jgi:hypothetical protein
MWLEYHLLFQGQVFLHSSLGVCYKSYLFQPVFSSPQFDLSIFLYTLRAMYNSILGVWETHTQFVQNFKFFKMHVHIIPEILVDLETMI